jgi:hypothetical protein
VSKSNSDRTDPKPDGPKLDLSLEDTIAQKMRGVSPGIKSGLSGYNPYDATVSKPADAAGESSKPTDLRKLSEWIRLTRQVAALKKDKPPEEEPG